MLTSRSLFILISLLIAALFASYLLQTRKIQAVHETVMSIFAGMRSKDRDFVGLNTETIRHGHWTHITVDRG